jgi:hypothetical protein
MCIWTSSIVADYTNTTFREQTAFVFKCTSRRKKSAVETSCLCNQRRWKNSKYTSVISPCYFCVLLFVFLPPAFSSFSDIPLSTKSRRAMNYQSTCLSSFVYLVMHQVFYFARFKVPMGVTLKITAF